MKKFVPLWLAILVATALLTFAAASAAVAKDLTYSFSQAGPQTATNGTGAGTQTIAETGSGSFDTDAPTIVASGTFQITDNLTGAVVSAGTWKATKFDSFCSRSGPSPGVQGGLLLITVTLFPVGAAPITDVKLTIFCVVGTATTATACSSAAKDFITVTGVTGFSDFTTGVHADNLFNLNQ